MWEQMLAVASAAGAYVCTTVRDPGAAARALEIDAEAEEIADARPRYRVRLRSEPVV